VADARTPEDLRDDLRRLGLEPGDTVMVHASLRALGPVVGRAAGVVAALDGAVGPDGTLLMTVGACDDWSWVNEHPEAERATLLADAEPFDLLRTPAEPDVGVLAEVFRTTRGTVASDHPEGRFAARGRRAFDLVDDVPWHDYYGAGSPLERLEAMGGKVLRLGADPDTVTLFHLAEFRAPLPTKRRVRRHRRVTGPEGPTIRVVETFDDSDGVVDWPGEDYFVDILEAYLATGRATVGTVGDARSEVFDAADAVAFAEAWIVEHLTALS
jgi:aminoglycoside N3'-acetyltransferase